MNKADRKTLAREVRKHCLEIIRRAKKLSIPGAETFFSMQIKHIRELSTEVQSQRGVHTYCLRAAIRNAFSTVKYAESGLYERFEGRAAYYSNHKG